MSAVFPSFRSAVDRIKRAAELLGVDLPLSAIEQAVAAEPGIEPEPQSGVVRVRR